MYESSKHPTVHDHGRTKTRVSARGVVTTFIVALAVIFVLQNTGRGRITFWFWEISAPAWIWLIVLFLLGVAVGSMVPWLGLGSRRKKSTGR